MNLDEWNAKQQANWDALMDAIKHPERHPNGLICPQDRGHLYDTGQTFLGPPQRHRVKCMNRDCNFRGERLVRINRIQD